MSFPLMPLAGPVPNAGETWTQVGGVSTGFDLKQLSVSPGGVWVVGADSLNSVLRSTDNGTTWSTSSTSAVLSRTFGSAYGGGLFVASDSVINSGRVASSPNGLTWSSRSSATSQNFRIRYNDGYFVIGAQTTPGGSGLILASPDGISWTINPQGVAGGGAVNCGIYVASLGRTFVSGSSSARKYVNAVPTAATAWTGISSGLPITTHDVCWSPTLSRAVVVGSGGMYSSQDLISWTLRQSATDMYGVSWCETQFVAVGSSGKIFTSTDGITWVSRTSGTTSALYGVDHLNGVILATGSAGTVLRSVA